VRHFLNSAVDGTHGDTAYVLLRELSNGNVVMTDTLFTIGYSGRTIDDLIGLLEQHKITALCKRAVHAV